MEERIKAILAESIRVKEALSRGHLDAVVRAVQAISLALRGGHKVLLFGNGGSAADAQHIAAEFVNRFLRDRPPLPALALTTDSSVLTSVSNDEAFREVFARQISALGSAGDVAWAITTSGISTNVIRGLEEARALGLVTVAVTGGTGEALCSLADHLIVVEHSRVPRIQEAQMTIGHIICELVEEDLYPDASGGGG